MGIGPFSSVDHNHAYNYYEYTRNTPPSPNPDPERWELLGVEKYANGYVLLVKYEGCTNFEGKKILVFKGQYQIQKALDPHFSKTGSSPFARFIPTKEALAAACNLAKSF